MLTRRLLFAGHGGRDQQHGEDEDQRHTTRPASANHASKIFRLKQKSKAVCSFEYTEEYA